VFTFEYSLILRENISIVSIERHEPNYENPVMRARRRLGDAAIGAAHLQAISMDEAKALGKHLGVPGFELAESKRRQIDKFLQGISQAIEFRESYLQTHRFMNGQEVPYSGMLGMAVGDAINLPASRTDLLQAPNVQAIAAGRRIDPNVVVDLNIARDLRWLSAPVKPK
jgi:hypothetical protein